MRDIRLRLKQCIDAHKKREDEFMHSVRMWIAVVLLVLCVAGCGETLRGIGRDVQRVGRGVKTIFVSDSY